MKVEDYKKHAFWSGITIIAFGWGLLLFINYFTFRIIFLLFVLIITSIYIIRKLMYKVK